jgi:cytidylate kinase
LCYLASKTNGSPSTSKVAMKNTPTIATSAEISLEHTKDTRMNPTTAQLTTSMDLTRNNIGDLILDDDVVEDLKKMKVNNTVFELCKITQLREQLCESLQHIQGP